MHLEQLLGPVPERPISAGLVGAGEFGRTFIAQMRLAPDLEMRVACDREVERAVEAFVSAGVERGGVRVCGSAREAAAALAAGDCVVVAEAALLVELPVDVVVEATGQPEAAAAIAELAIGHGKHVVMVTKEAESVVGPLLTRKAEQAGVVYTPADGDQPSLLIGLVAWCRLLGLEIVAAGKASEYDFVYDPATDNVTAQGRSQATPGFGALWRAEGGAAARVAGERGELLAGFWQRTAPDLCEMTIVANATGLLPSRPALHAPIARTLELPDLLAPRSAGGLLSETGVVDIFNCLRRPDEMSFAGGVFVVARAPDAETCRLFGEKGIPVSADGERFLVSNIVHLLGAEAPMSILSACRAGRSTGGADVRPRVDLTARTTAAIPAGTRFELGWRHAIDGIEAQMTPALPLAPDHAVPHYLLPGAVARVEIPAGTVVTGAMVEAPAGSTLWRLRAEQDATFAGEGSVG
jgi:predicted homoserine dehydrogenase-like protein